MLNMHTAFWSMLSGTPSWWLLLSLFFDVPAYFLISGILSKECGPRQGLTAALRQMGRLYGTYWCVTLVGMALVFSTGRTMPLGEFWRLAIVSPSPEAWAPFVGFPGSIWFLRVFLILLPGIALARALPTRWVLAAAAGALILWIATGIHPVAHFDNSLPFHAALAFVGVVAGRLIRSGRLSRNALLATALVSIALVATWFIAFGAPDPVHMKFPPSFEYLLWCIPSLALLSSFVVAERDGLVLHGSLWIRFLSWCGRHVFEFYMVQGFVASLPFLLATRLDAMSGAPRLAAYSLAFLWNIVATSLLVLAIVSTRTFLRRLSPRHSGHSQGIPA